MNTNGLSNSVRIIKSKQMTIIGDNPIRVAEDDVLGRVNIARAFAQQILSLDATQGVVVGVLGPWGSGKTSLINLTRSEFKRVDVPLLDFNPWMFSGEEQLVDSFFVELAAQLKIRPNLTQVGKDLQEYGEAFSGMAGLPLVGPWIERIRISAKLLGKLLQRRKGGIGERRIKLEKTLNKLAKPVVVVLDDIDRLSTSEIQCVFKLVRLTASFPNIIYVVAFDRARVEKALSELGVPGRDYLEKILQVALDLPSIPNQVLNQRILSSVDDALVGIEKPGPFDEQVWPDVFMEIIRPLFRNMRDVRRYAAAIHGAVAALEGQIALADVLALEAVRIFLPDVFTLLHGAIIGLTATSDDSYGRADNPPGLKRQIEGLVEASGSHIEVVQSMIERLFPAGKRYIGGSHYGNDWKGEWFKERRVAHEDILRFYLERVEGEGFQVLADAERVWACLSNRDTLNVCLGSIDSSRVQDVIAALETFENDFAPQHVVPGTIVLLNFLKDLPRRQRGIFELDTEFVVRRVAYRLLKSLEDPAVLEAAVRNILPELNSLSAKLHLIDIVGYREHVGHKLISQTAATEIEKAWLEEVRGVPADQLAEENNLLRILLVAKRKTGAPEGPILINSSPQFTLAVFRNSRHEVISQTTGSRAERRFPQLSWDALIELYGGEDILRRRIEDLKATRLEGSDEILELADKYLGGWRPNDFSGREK